MGGTACQEFPMSEIIVKPVIKPELRVERPRLYKVILVNDDFTPREFVTQVLKAEFGMTEAQAHAVMYTAHTRGLCVVAVFTKDIAETRATPPPVARRTKGNP